jgi:protein-S-isoprenylcysteine O-methyltransferase Ste14
VNKHSQRFLLNLVLIFVIAMGVPHFIEPWWPNFAGGLLAGYVTVGLLRLVDHVLED